MKKLIVLIAFWLVLIACERIPYEPADQNNQSEVPEIDTSKLQDMNIQWCK
jgi:hypothetical protein